MRIWEASTHRMKLNEYKKDAFLSFLSSINSYAKLTLISYAFIFLSTFAAGISEILERLKSLQI